MQGIVEQAFGRARFHDLAEVQDGDVVADVLDHPEIVGDEQIAEAELVLQPAQEVEDLCLYRDVEGGDGLVAAEEFRAAGERAGDGDALALAAGKLVREEPRLIRAQAHGLHEPQHLAAAPLLRADVQKIHRLADDVPGPAARVQGGVRVLENELDPPPERGQGVAAQGEDAFPVEQDVAGGGLHKAHDPPGYGGLAAAALADEPERPAPLQREGNVVRRVHEALAVEEVALHGREADVQVPDFKQRDAVCGYGHGKLLSGGAALKQAVPRPPDVVNGGRSVEQAGLASAQRGAKAQPGPMSRMDGTMPGISRSGACRLSPSRQRCGMQAMSPCV